MAGKPVKITNTGDAPVQAVVSVSGSPVTPEPAASNGFKIERTYYTLDGKPADITKAKQNDRFVVVLKITEAKPEYGHIMVADYLPAGLEIDNPRLVSSGDSGTLDWIEDGEEPEHTEFRDDRFIAALDRASGRPGGVHRRLCRARGVARQIRAAAGLCRGHVQSLALRPHRHRHGRGAAGEMSDDAATIELTRHARACPGHPPLCREKNVDGRDKPGHDGGGGGGDARSSLHRACVVRRQRLRRSGSFRSVRCRWTQARQVSTDDRRPRRQAAARLRHRRRPLAAAGRRQADVDPALSRRC